MPNKSKLKCPECDTSKYVEESHHDCLLVLVEKYIIVVTVVLNLIKVERNYNAKRL